MSTRRVVETLARRMSGPSRARRVGGAHVQVLHPGADARDATCASVLLCTDDARVVFNVGEGFQRLCVERRVKALKRCERVLLTRADSRAAGGLVGTLLTMSDEAETRRGLDAGVERRRVEVCGPDGRLSLIHI